MDSNEPKIKCENCRQEIIAKKMFLHEGFCKRNNVFCQHCERVYLKKDYDAHLLEISKKKKQNSKELKSNSKKCLDEREEVSSLKNHDQPPKTKKIQIIEQYKINNPIIISPFGEIISKKNTNEFILPYLGIQQSQDYNLFGEEDFLNEEEKSKINNHILKYAYDNINLEEVNIKKMKKFYSYYNMNNANNVNNLNIQNNFNQNQYQNKNKNLFPDDNPNIFIQKINNEEKKENENNEINNNKNNNLVIREINMNDDNNALEWRSQPYSFRSTNPKKTYLTEENELKNKDPNNIIINNNIITYNSNSQIKKLNNMYNSFETNTQKIGALSKNSQNMDNNSPIKFVSKYQVKTQFNPIRRLKRKGKKKLKQKIITSDITNKTNNISELYSKEPLDNMAKKKFKNKNNNFEESKNNTSSKNINTEPNSVIFYNKKYNKKQNYIKNNFLNKDKILNPIKIDFSTSNIISNQDIIDNMVNSLTEEKNNEGIIKSFNPPYSIIQKKSNKGKKTLKGKSEEKYVIKKKVYQTNTVNNTKNNYANKIIINSPAEIIRNLNGDKKPIVHNKQKKNTIYENEQKVKNENRMIKKISGIKLKNSNKKKLTKKKANNSSNNLFAPITTFEQISNNVNYGNYISKYSIENNNIAFNI